MLLSPPPHPGLNSTRLRCQAPMQAVCRPKQLDGWLWCWGKGPGQGSRPRAADAPRLQVGRHCPAALWLMVLNQSLAPGGLSSAYTWSHGMPLLRPRSQVPRGLRHLLRTPSVAFVVSSVCPAVASLWSCPPPASQPRRLWASPGSSAVSAALHGAFMERPVSGLVVFSGVFS